MQEHDIGIADQALLAAIDGVFADDRRGLFLLALMTRLSEDTPPPLRTTENSHRRTV